MLYQILSLTGAALILIAYVANQRGLLGPRNATYNLMNLLGALLLLWVAVVDWRWGFILLEERSLATGGISSSPNSGSHSGNSIPTRESR